VYSSAAWAIQPAVRATAKIAMAASAGGVGEGPQGEVWVGWRRRLPPRVLDEVAIVGGRERVDGFEQRRRPRIAVAVDRVAESRGDGFLR
jgi:hypothetical protein